TATLEGWITCASTPRALSQRANQKPSRPASKASAIRVIFFPALTASSRQRCNRPRSLSALGSSFLRGWRSMPGSTPPTSQLDWLISTTAMIVLSWSKATRDLLKSFSWGIGALRQLFASDDGAISFAACPIPSLRWREPDSNHRSLLYDKHPNWLEKAPELCAQGQPRCVRTREMLGRSRYPNNRMARQGPTSCPNALPNPARGTLGVRAQSAYLGMKW